MLKYAGFNYPALKRAGFAGHPVKKTMLKNTFCHLPGIGLKSERHLWDKGIYSWDACVNGPSLPPRYSPLKGLLTQSYEQLKCCNPSFFIGAMQAAEHWRLFPEFRSSTAYLDIETNGYAGPRGYITAISLYDGQAVYNYVKGRNLNDFKRDINRYKLLVTFNGKCFDIPFIEKHFKMTLPQAHIDLRYILRDLGLTGGLKSCEKRVGIDRKELDGVDGFFAVLLWQDFKRRKNQKALETLLAYNVQDVINLETLMVFAYNQKISDTPFRKTNHIPEPSMPELPFKADPQTIERIFSENTRFYQQSGRAL